MKNRTKIVIAAGVVLAGTGGGIAAHAATQPGRGTFESATSEGTAIYGNCGIDATTTTTYFYWSSASGWERYPAPKVANVYVVTCHAIKGKAVSFAAVAGYNPCKPGQFIGTCTVRFTHR